MKADMLDLSTQIEHAVNGVAGHSPHSATDNATIVVDRDQLRRACRGLAIQGATLMTMVATDDDTAITLRYIFALPMGLGRPSHIVTIEVAVPTDDLTYPSATLDLPAAHWYEREARDMFGAVPVGHPDPRRLVLHDDWPDNYHPLLKSVDGHVAPPLQAVQPFQFRVVQGEDVSEVPVGPIHAGIIEPGHFRFSVVGEQIINLEARLFYVHRGVEKLCEGLSVDKALEIVERICGVCTFSHAMAYCQAVEAIGVVAVPPRAVALRTVLMELERLYNHIGDIGNICSGVAFAAGTMEGARLKDQLQSLAERITGSRYLRSMARPGGLWHDVPDATVDDIRSTIDMVGTAFAALQVMLLGTPSLMSRFTDTGFLRRQAALDLGAVGVAMRASGIARDSRVTMPYAGYDAHRPAIVVETGEDVKARFMVRVREAHESMRLIGSLIDSLPEGDIHAEVGELDVGRHALGWAESPRGEHVHWLRVGPDNTVDRLRVRAASFCNWPVVPLTVPGNMVPDFPLINKSFELCYSCLDR